MTRCLQPCGTVGAPLLLAALTACGREAQSPPGETRTTAARVASPAAQTAPGKAVTSSSDPVSNHDLFAAQGIDCKTCHPCGESATHETAWMDRTSSTFHAVAADSGLAGCQTCHGTNLDGVGGTTTVSCAMCHGASWATNCTMCHGGVDNSTGAPAAAIWGQAGDANRGGGTLDPVRVGAHTSHLSAKHGLAAPVACSSCHVVPADAFASGHIDGPTATVTFSGMAAQGTPAWRRASATCAGTYCHGATLTGGTLTNPVWTTTDGAQIACGSCHGLPPPVPHPQNPACGTCHPGYTASAVNGAVHVDGKLDVILTCTSCHGTAGVNAAPPLGTQGEMATTTTAVGAHQAHLAGAKVGKAVACGECHVVPTSMAHADGTVQVRFGTLSASGGLAPVWNGVTCTNTYCHGASLPGGTNKTPAWTIVDGSQDACGSCHTNPPPPPHVTRSDCGTCHAGYTSSSVNLATHVNGTVEVAAMTCTSCHGRAGQDATAGSPSNAAPPLDTLGAANGLRVGAHQAHVVGRAFSSGTACQNCHAGVGTYTTMHSNGVNEVAFVNGTSPSFRTGTFRPRNGSTPASCASTWCHAVRDQSGHVSGGTLPTPTWTGAITACTGCHAVPPMTGAHDESEHRVPCGYCHPGYAATTSANGTTVNEAIHVNGMRDVGGTGTRIRSWDATTRRCRPMCHDSETW